MTAVEERVPAELEVDPGADLCRFVDAAPSPFHAVDELARRLRAAGFSSLEEADRWSLSPGDRRYVVRDGSLAAFVVGTDAPADAGYRMVGTHTDSPVLRVRPRPDVSRAGYRLVGVEPYGGGLWHTWLDRDLTLAGRVAVRVASGAIETRLVRLPGAPLRIPSLAPHLGREVLTDGLKLNPQLHLVPIWGIDAGSPDGLREVLAAAVGVPPADALGTDLATADTQPSALVGGDAALVAAPRLDNLSSCHAGASALVAAAASSTASTSVLIANDHEEVGSQSAEGARGSFLADVVSRVGAACGDADPQDGPRAMARSLLVSADAAHAVHPNHVERHEPEHRPILGGGPVLKVNAAQAYATDAASGAWFAARCADAGVPLQHFVSRSDIACGSTIGPLTAMRLGVQTVDIGNPLLGMHASRETGGADDVALLVAALRAHLLA